MKKKRKGLFRWFRKGSAGVTVFEVMIALALFAVIITPVMRSFVTAIKVNKRSRDVMVATDVADAVMEGIKGKTYEEVVKALCSAPAGFTTSVEDKDGSAKLALSSINENWYNQGHVGGMDPTKKILKKGGAAMTTGDYSGDYKCEYRNLGDNNCHVRTSDEIDDQVMAINAIKELRANFNPALTYEEYTATKNDKLLYFGFNDVSDDYLQYDDPDIPSGKGIPKMCYMLYSRIEKDNRFFDVTVSFIPRSHNINKDDPTMRRSIGGGAYEKSDTYFIYEVTVKVYEYHYDPFTNAWIGRFAPDADRFDGAPIAELHTGIYNKSLNQ